MGRTALAESGVVSPAMGVAAVITASLGTGLVSGIYDPDAIADEELDPTARRLLVASLLVGGAAALVLFALTYT
nr:hypothetical protein [Halobellus ruber]